MAVVSMVNERGEKGLLAFTGVDSMAAWNPQARPVPSLGRDIARSAIDDGATAVVLDVAGPHAMAVSGAALTALADLLDLARVTALVHGRPGAPHVRRLGGRRGLRRPADGCRGRRHRAGHGTGRRPSGRSAAGGSGPSGGPGDLGASRDPPPGARRPGGDSGAVAQFDGAMEATRLTAPRYLDLLHVEGERLLLAAEGSMEPARARVRGLGGARRRRPRRHGLRRTRSPPWSSADDPSRGSGRGRSRASTRSRGATRSCTGWLATWRGWPRTSRRGRGGSRTRPPVSGSGGWRWRPPSTGRTSRARSGPVTPIDADLALDGIDELLHVMLADAGIEDVRGPVVDGGLGPRRHRGHVGLGRGVRPAAVAVGTDRCGAGRGDAGTRQGCASCSAARPSEATG